MTPKFAHWCRPWWLKSHLTNLSEPAVSPGSRSGQLSWEQLGDFSLSFSHWGHFTQEWEGFWEDENPTWMNWSYKEANCLSLALEIKTELYNLGCYCYRKFQCFLIPDGECSVTRVTRLVLHNNIVFLEYYGIERSMWFLSRVCIIVSPVKTLSLFTAKFYCD